MHPFILELIGSLKAAGNPEKAEQMNAYMRSKFEFYGVQGPERKHLLAQALKTHGKPNNRELKEWLYPMWNNEYRELHYCAQELCKRVKLYAIEKNIDAIEWLLTHQSWWDTVDYLSTNVVGHYVKQHPKTGMATILKWNNSNHLWLIRSSILFQLKYNEATDFQLLQQLIQPHLKSDEFFIQKAIGWALCQYAKRSPDEVRLYCATASLSPLSKREALKHLT